MGNIKINSLTPVKPARQTYVFKDLALDLKFGYTKNAALEQNIQINDAVASYDSGAIHNSIYNLFNTNKGERPLSPDFGLNLKNFIFAAITDFNAHLLGEAILEGIRKYETRIDVIDVSIVKNVDENTYEVYIEYQIPLLKGQTLSVSGVLSNSGFKLK